jgi:aspartate/methionine/tyrosine aminotransferase
MFSARTRWTLTPNRLARALESRRAAGRPVLDLTESNPTRAGLTYPADLLAPLAEPRGLQYEPTPLGHRAAREAVAADYARRGVALSPDDILLTASTSEAYSFVFKLLCDPHDEVLIPAPSYPLFDFLAGLESTEVRPYPLLLADGEWHLDVAALEALLTPRSRAIVVVNPNNPTGSFLKQDEAAALYALAARHALALVSDEVFLDYAFGEDDRRFGTVAAGGPALGFAMGGLSKACGLPQLKLGWLAISGPETLRREARERLEVVADTYLSVGTPVQLAAPALLARRAELQAPIATRVADNRRALAASIRGSAASLLPTEGGWYAVLQVPATQSEEDLATRLAEEDGVLVHPGFFFGFAREGFVVVSLLSAPAAMAEGVSRLLARL